MNIGAMSEFITVQQRSSTVDALGQAVETWADVASMWAQAEPLRGREYFAAGEMQSGAEVRFRLRHQAGITAAMRVVWRGTAHAIVGTPIDVDGRRRVLELMCAAGARDTR